MSDTSHIDQMLFEAACYKSTAAQREAEAMRLAESTELERNRPFMLLRPRIFIDGNQWCALYGENLQEGVAGFGDTPAKASVQFDIEWLNAPAQKTEALERSFPITLSPK